MKAAAPSRPTPGVRFLVAMPVYGKKQIKECALGDVVRIRGVVRYVAWKVDELVTCGLVVDPAEVVAKAIASGERAELQKLRRDGSHYTYPGTEVAEVIFPQSDRIFERTRWHE